MNSPIVITGMGLVSAKKLSEAMAGTIGLSSIVGTGSTFWIELPAVDPAAFAKIITEDTSPTPVEEPLPAEKQPTQEQCVLYVEDTPANAMLMKQYFSVLPGAPELIVAETGEEGVEVACARHPDMILMDINLPGISGLEAMLQLREIPDCAATPIVAISADAMPDEIQKARDAGFDDYLTKPIKLKMLKTVIEIGRAHV